VFCNNVFTHHVGLEVSGRCSVSILTRIPVTLSGIFQGLFPPFLPGKHWDSTSIKSWYFLQIYNSPIILSSKAIQPEILKASFWPLKICMEPKTNHKFTNTTTQQNYYWKLMVAQMLKKLWTHLSQLNPVQTITSTFFRPTLIWSIHMASSCHVFWLQFWTY
jgi:hypothetical protein